MIEKGRMNTNRQILCDDTGLSKSMCLCAGVSVYNILMSSQGLKDEKIGFMTGIRINNRFILALRFSNLFLESSSLKCKDSSIT